MADEAFPIRCRIPVQWGEMDALGHVNNTRFFAWMEAARIEYVARAGVRADAEGVGPILASITCDFLRPVVYPAEVEVGVRAIAIGTTSVTMEYALTLVADGSLVARGRSVIVLVRYATGTKTAVPANVRLTIERLEGRSFG